MCFPTWDALKPSFSDTFIPVSIALFIWWKPLLPLLFDLQLIPRLRASEEKDQWYFIWPAHSGHSNLFKSRSSVFCITSRKEAQVKDWESVVNHTQY